MIKNITGGYKKLFKAIGMVVLLCALCLASGFIIVFPLWKWASVSPSTYTWFIIALLAFFLIFFIIRYFISKGTLKALLKIARIVTLAGGLVLCFFLVLKDLKWVALAVLPVVFVLYGILAFGIKDSHR